MASLYDDYIQIQATLQKCHSREALEAILAELRSFFSQGRREEIYPIFNPNVNFPIYLRRGTSDFSNFLQIFVHAEYSPCFSSVPETILDLGSYIGLSAIYFANRFPKAKIICVEPSADNYELLRLNTKSYDNIIPIHAGIWSHRTKLKMVKQVGGDWGNILEETDEVEGIEALSIPDLVDQFKITTIDFLKIDIEGSEKQVFSENTALWFKLVKMVACETHDRFVPGCTAAYENLFKNNDFEYFQTGEFKTFVRKEISTVDRVRF
ncbi:MAG: FkbM family methyltransferase [Prochlorotrichaceae cyanobacterium]|jgi:FkbM family methyltransferase